MSEDKLSTPEYVIGKVLGILFFILIPLGILGVVGYDVYNTYKTHDLYDRTRPCADYDHYRIKDVPARCLKEYYPTVGKLPAEPCTPQPGQP